MSDAEYLTTRELAELLRIKERKVYDLAASGEVPCSKAMGKLLFPRRAITAWLAHSSSGPDLPELRRRPDVMLGSHDPLLEWALRQSGCGIATFFDGSGDGLDRFANGGGIAAGLHLYDAGSDTWNVADAEAACGHLPAVLISWARRSRGLVLAKPFAGKISRLADLRGHRFAPRQPQAGAQRLFETLAARDGFDLTDLHLTEPARNEADAALAVREGKADAAFGLETCAHQYGLSFAPVLHERFDLLIDRRAFFEPPMQTFLTFCTSPAFRLRAEEMTGYDISGFGQVRFNAA